jgi:hypothetical protein
MRTHHVRLMVLGLTGIVLASAGPSAQKGKKPTLLDIPGQTVLRCAGPADAFTDSVCGDGNALYVDHALAGGDLGVLTSLREGDNQLRLRFDPLGGPARTLTVFKPNRLLPLLSHECTSNCLTAAEGSVVVGVIDGTNDARIQTTMRATAGNPTSLGIGEAAPIDILIGFEDPGGGGYRWGLYWSPDNYPGSTPATITRTGSCTWDVEAGVSDVAGLRLFGTGINTGSGRTRGHYEGRFNMPFKLTFTADPATLPAGCA